VVAFIVIVTSVGLLLSGICGAAAAILSLNKHLREYNRESRISGR
jgi:hypothetical protein